MNTLIRKIKETDLYFSVAAAACLLIFLFALLSGPVYASIAGIVLALVIWQLLTKDKRVVELQAARQSLERSKELLEATERISGSAGWELNVATGSGYWTRQMFSIHGVAEAYIPSIETGLEFYTVDSRDVIREAMKEAVDNARSVVVEAEVLPAEGRYIKYVRISMVPVLEGENVILLRGAVMDITGQKENEAKLIAIKEDLEKSNRHMSHVMKIVAHDLRNPINGIIGLTSLMLLNKDIKSEDKEVLNLIIESGERSKRLIGDIMGVTSMHEGVMINPRETEMKGMLKRLVQMLQFVAADKDLVLRFDARKGVMANLDEDKIARVVNNIISNAIKFSPHGKFIDINLSSSDHHLLISVRDFGIGIPADIQQQVFEMFTSAKRPGTSGEKPYGLGLHISKKIVEAHRGKIWLESREGNGTTFYIELPLDIPCDMTIERPRFMLYG